MKQIYALVACRPDSINNPFVLIEDSQERPGVIMRAVELAKQHLDARHVLTVEAFIDNHDGEPLDDELRGNIKNMLLGELQEKVAARNPDSRNGLRESYNAAIERGEAPAPHNADAYALGLAWDIERRMARGELPRSTELPADTVMEKWFNTLRRNNPVVSAANRAWRMDGSKEPDIPQAYVLPLLETFGPDRKRNTRRPSSGFSAFTKRPTTKGENHGE